MEDHAGGGEGHGDRNGPVEREARPRDVSEMRTQVLTFRFSGEPSREALLLLLSLFSFCVCSRVILAASSVGLSVFWAP